MANNNLDQDYQALKADVAKLRTDLSSLLGSVGEQAKEQTRAGKDQITERASKAGNEIQAQYEEKPLLFLLVTFVLGIFLGKLVSSKH